jgi:hypothetical protein
MKYALLATMLLLLIVITAGTIDVRGQSLQEQAICAQQAEKAFQAYNNVSDPHYKLLTSAYQSHYNKKINKCLVLINEMSVMNEEFMETAELIDAFENRQFANYIRATKQGRKSWEAEPLNCVLRPSLNNETLCSSRREFDAFVSTYMDQ